MTLIFHTATLSERVKSHCLATGNDKMRNADVWKRVARSQSSVVYMLHTRVYNVLCVTLFSRLLSLSLFFRDSLFLSYAMISLCCLKNNSRFSPAAFARLYKTFSFQCWLVVNFLTFVYHVSPCVYTFFSLSLSLFSCISTSSKTRLFLFDEIYVDVKIVTEISKDDFCYC